MAQILSTITCDLGRGSCTPSPVRVMQYDSDIRYIAVKFLDKGQAWNVPVGYAVKLRMMKSDGTPTCKPVDNVTGNTAQFQVTADMCKNGWTIMSHKLSAEWKYRKATEKNVRLVFRQ